MVTTEINEINEINRCLFLGRKAMTNLDSMLKSRDISLPTKIHLVKAMFLSSCHVLGFPGGSDSKASACNAGNPGSIPGSGRSPGEGNGNPPQCSCLENPMDGGIWWAIVHGVAKSWTQLNNFMEVGHNFPSKE